MNCTDARTAMALVQKVFEQVERDPALQSHLMACDACWEHWADLVTASRESVGDFPWHGLAGQSRPRNDVEFLSRQLVDLRDFEQTAGRLDELDLNGVRLQVSATRQGTDEPTGLSVLAFDLEGTDARLEGAMLVLLERGDRTRVAEMVVFSKLKKSRPKFKTTVRLYRRSDLRAIGQKSGCDVLALYDIKLIRDPLFRTGLEDVSSAIESA